MKTEHTTEPLANVTPWMWTGGGMIQHAQGSFCYITDAAAELATLRQHNQQLCEALRDVLVYMPPSAWMGLVDKQDKARAALAKTKP